MIVLPSWMRIMLASGICFAAGGIVALYISPRTLSWYESLNVPLFFALPLPAIFFVAVVTYALLSLAASLMWIHDPKPWDFRGWVPLCFSHLFLNMAWYILFFGYNVVFLSMVTGMILSVVVMMLMAAAWSHSRIAFWVLAPYFVWTLYALGMNMAVWLNK